MSSGSSKRVTHATTRWCAWSTCLNLAAGKNEGKKWEARWNGGMADTHTHGAVFRDLARLSLSHRSITLALSPRPSFWAFGILSSSPLEAVSIRIFPCSPRFSFAGVCPVCTRSARSTHSHTLDDLCSPCPARISTRRLDAGRHQYPAGRPSCRTSARLTITRNRLSAVASARCARVCRIHLIFVRSCGESARRSRPLCTRLL